MDAQVEPRAPIAVASPASSARGTVRHPQLLEAGLFLVVVTTPLALFVLGTAPFVDVKILLLAAGTLLVWTSGISVDRRLAIPAGTLIGVLSLAALTGVDPYGSLIGAQGEGLAMLACSAVLLAVAPNLTAVHARMLSRWLVTTGVIVAAVVTIGRLFPDATSSLTGGLSLDGSTLGNPVFAGAFLSVAVAAALASPWRSDRRTIVALIALGTGLSFCGQRTSLVLPIVAAALALRYTGASRRRAVIALGTLALTLVVWFPITSNLTGQVTELQSITSDRARFIVYAANLEAVPERPILGWGPANAWSSYLSEVGRGGLQIAGRNWADTHNIVLEILVTGGVLALLAFAFLVWRVLPGIVRGPRAPTNWASPVALTIGVFFCYEPLNVPLTAVLFLAAGIAVGQRRRTNGPPEQPRAQRQVARLPVTLGLSAVLVLAGLNLGASALEQWGRNHFAPWALRASITLQPWRVTAVEALATGLAIDFRSGDEAAGREAHRLIEDAVAQHPWNPGVRLAAADVETLLRNFPGAQEWIRRQLEVFPGDDIEVPTEPPALPVLPSPT